MVASEGGVCTCFRSSSQLEHVTPEDEDVLQEETTVKQQTHEGIVDSNTAVQIRGLTKTYPGSTSLGCCKCNRTPPYHALRVRCIIVVLVFIELGVHTVRFSLV